MDEKEKKIFQYATNVYGAIEDMLTNEESDYYVNLSEAEDGDIAPFLTGMCMAHLTVLNELCRSECTYLGGIHMENRLIVQYLMKYGKIHDGKEDE